MQLTPQDQISGAAAAAWGFETARRIAAQLGAQMLSRNSNECRLDGRLIVIKTAAATTDSVGVTYRMLERLDAVFGCWEQKRGEFDIWELSPSQFLAASRDSRSTGGKGKVGIVRRSVFESEGKRIRTVSLGARDA